MNGDCLCDIFILDKQENNILREKRKFTLSSVKLAEGLAMQQFRENICISPSALRRNLMFFFKKHSLIV